MALKFFKELFGGSEIDAVAEQLVNELLEAVIGKAVSKSQEWDLGVVGKAKLGNSVKWALKEKGYPDKFIEVVTEGLVVYMTRRSSEVSKG